MPAAFAKVLISSVFVALVCSVVESMSGRGLHALDKLNTPHVPLSVKRLLRFDVGPASEFAAPLKETSFFSRTTDSVKLMAADGKEKVKLVLKWLRLWKEKPRPATSVSLPRPATSVSLPRPATSVGLPRPATSVSLPRPATSVGLRKSEVNPVDKVYQVLGFEKTVMSINTRYPNDIAMQYDTLVSSIGISLAKVTRVLIRERSSGKIKNIAAELLEAQIKSWTDTGKTADDIFKLLKLNKIKGARYFSSEVFRYWVSFVTRIDYGASTKWMYDCLSEFFGKDLTIALAEGKRIEGASSVVPTLLKYHLRGSKTTEEDLFNLLKLKFDTQLFEKPFVNIWLDYLFMVQNDGNVFSHLAGKFEPGVFAKMLDAPTVRNTLGDNWIKLHFEEWLKMGLSKLSVEEKLLGEYKFHALYAKEVSEDFAKAKAKQAQALSSPQL